MRTLFSRLKRTLKPSQPAGETPEILLCRKLGYQFSDIALLRQALKHRSYLAESGEPRANSNERLELLGDAVFGLVVVEHLYQHFPRKAEGDLTVMKSLAVSRKVIADVAAQIGIGEFLLLSAPERRSGGEKRPSILADAMEAIIGAVYLDGGLESATEFVHRHLLTQLPGILKEERHRNFKSLLLEYCQKEGMPSPAYWVKDEEGPDHDKVFTVEVGIGERACGTGRGRSKKRAEQNAAREALRELRVL